MAELYMRDLYFENKWNLELENFINNRIKISLII